MNKQTKQQALLQRLRTLTNRPDEQLLYALELLESALAVVNAVAFPQARPVLLQLYAYFDAAGVKRDAGGHLRKAILAALLPIADRADWILAERAAKTYEFAPQENAGELRVAGISLLSHLDPALANYHCTRLLFDPHTSRMSGQPAVSAVSTLAEQQSFLPLYAYVLDSLNGRESISEVVGECLKYLSSSPLSVVDDLFDRYTAISPSTREPIYESKDDLELLGFFDLLLAHATRNTYLDFIRIFLKTTRRYEVYRYIVTMIVANHQLAIWTMLQEVARVEQNRNKIEILLSALALVQSDSAVANLICKLQQRQ